MTAITSSAMTMGRVLVIETQAVLGGAEISSLGMVDGLRKLGWKVAVVCPGPGPLADELRRLGVRVVFETVHPKTFSPSTSSWWRWLSDGLGVMAGLPAVLRVALWARRQRIDIVHAHGFRAAIWVPLLKVMAGAQLGVWHQHVFYRYGCIGALIGRLSDGVIANSHAVLQTCIEGGIPSDRLRTIYNGVDLCKFRPSNDSDAARLTFGLPTSVPVVGFVGRLAPRKGLDDLIRAVPLVLEVLPDAHFLIVGEELFFDDNVGYKSKLIALAQGLGVVERVHFAGFRSDVPVVMAALDVLAFPSWHEPFGRGIIEAMALERPVVACNSGGVVEIITPDEDGILVAPRNVPELARALTDLLKQPERRRTLGRRAREVILDRFSMRSYVQSISDYYLELLSRSRSGGPRA